MSDYVKQVALAPLAAGLRSGEVDLLKWIEIVCQRMDAFDDTLQALLPEARRAQRLREDSLALLRRFPDPATRPALFGVPVGVKDIFRVDGFPTQAGSALPADLFAGAEAASVRRLRAAGALILGKTVTTEFAYFEPGPTRNPNALDHTPGGSSSGSAAAVAAGFCPLALGTQTIGSVLRPAAYCGVLGFKPSYGRIPMDGVIPFSISLDTVGIFTADVAGMALGASVLCDGWGAPSIVASRRPVVGVPRGAYLEQAEPAGLASLQRTLERLHAAGYSVVDVPALEEIAEINRRHKRLMAAEAAQVHAAWLADHASLYRPRTLALLREGQDVPQTEIEAARGSRLALREHLHVQMDHAGIGLWICPPALGTAPVGLSFTGDPAMNLPWTHAGLPCLSLPAGTIEGLPVGIQLVAGFGQDETLLAWAKGMEQVVAG